jgi:coenzyme F420 hydrogenase subunit delta
MVRTALEDIQGVFTKPVLVFGCGNVLLGDDGFGPSVIQHLRQRYQLPPHMHVVDVGTSIRNILFDLALLEKKPKLIIIVDAVEFENRKPGEVFEIPLDSIPEQKVDNYSLHQFPTVNLLRELRDQGQTNIAVFVAQVGESPEEVKPGLSKPMRAAVPEICKRILQHVERASETLGILDS